MANKLISFDELFYCGLFGFIRKIELSIHRAQSISELIDFIDLNEGEYNSVIQKLSAKLPNKERVFIKKYMIPTYLRRIMGKYLYSNKLFESEIKYLIDLLLNLKLILSRDSNIQKDNNDELRQIRLNLRYFYEYVIGSRINEKIKNKLLCVEHLNQNSYNNNRAIRDIIGDWY